MKPFAYIAAIPPIDFFDNALIADNQETQRVLQCMPEEPRSEIVYKIPVISELELKPVFICKAENNGTCYLFGDWNFNDNLKIDDFIRR